ncbi:MAG: NYN domain-containing protein, partial [Chloroflexota bacterium]|nr:NYN domain-containing protein [Chloroflexota bacterium]
MVKRPSYQDQERVAIFIDGSNFYHGLKATVGHTDVDFWAFTQKLCGERKLIRTYYYNVAVDPTREPERSRDQLKFFERLHATPYFTMKLGRMVYRDNVGMEKGVDVKLTIDMLRLAWQDTYDTAILVTGDGDFMDVVEAVKDLGKHVEGVYFHQGLSLDLAHACDKMEYLDKVALQDCWMEKREGPGRRRTGRRPGG